MISSSGPNSDEPQQEEPAPVPAPLPAAANPQLSPTHPPVVINPDDDDEDEDGAFLCGVAAKVLTRPVLGFT